VAAIKIKTCLYLQNKIKSVSENIGNIFFYICQLSIGSREWTNHSFFFFFAFYKMSPTILEMGLYYTAWCEATDRWEDTAVIYEGQRVKPRIFPFQTQTCQISYPYAYLDRPVVGLLQYTYLEKVHLSRQMVFLKSF